MSAGVAGHCISSPPPLPPASSSFPYPSSPSPPWHHFLPFLPLIPNPLLSSPFGLLAHQHWGPSPIKIQVRGLRSVNCLGEAQLPNALSCILSVKLNISGHDYEQTVIKETDTCEYAGLLISV